MSIRSEAAIFVKSWSGELDAPVVELRMIESLLAELEKAEKVVDAAEFYIVRRIDDNGEKQQFYEALANHRGDEDG